MLQKHLFYTCLEVMRSVAAEGISGWGANKIQAPHNERRPPPPKKKRWTFQGDITAKIVEYCRNLYQAVNL